MTLPPLPPPEFVPQAPIDVPPPAPKPEYFEKLMPFITVLILGVITLSSAGLLYRARQQNISPTTPSRSSASESTAPVSYTFTPTPTPAPVSQLSLWQRFVNFWLKLFRIKY